MTLFGGQRRLTRDQRTIDRGTNRPPTQPAHATITLQLQKACMYDQET